jgi:hypothetical protein
MTHEHDYADIRIAGGLDEDGSPVVELKIGHFEGCMAPAAARRLASGLTSAANAAEAGALLEEAVAPFDGPVSSKGGRG